MLGVRPPGSRAPLPGGRPLFVMMGDRAADTLDSLETALARCNTAIMAVLLLIIGVKLIGDSITGLSG